jgi:hypothetical protein
VYEALHALHARVAKGRQDGRASGHIGRGRRKGSEREEKEKEKEKRRLSPQLDLPGSTVRTRPHDRDADEPAAGLPRVLLGALVRERRTWT